MFSCKNCTVITISLLLHNNSRWRKASSYACVQLKFVIVQLLKHIFYFGVWNHHIFKYIIPYVKSKEKKVELNHKFSKRSFHIICFRAFSTFIVQIEKLLKFPFDYQTLLSNWNLQKVYTNLFLKQTIII